MIMNRLTYFRSSFACRINDSNSCPRKISGSSSDLGDIIGMAHNYLENQTTDVTHCKTTYDSGYVSSVAWGTESNRRPYLSWQGPRFLVRRRVFDRLSVWTRYETAL